MTSIKKAVIIGGGVAGPATAIALRKAGIDSAVYEAYATASDDAGGVLMVAPNGINALRLIGIDIESLDGIGQPIQRQVISDNSGKRLFEFAGIPGLPASQVIWRGELCRALKVRAESLGITIELGKRLVEVEEHPDGITARFADGTTASGDILIGADGIRSTVRRLIDPSAPEPEYVGLLGFGGYASGSGVAEPTDVMHFLYGRHAFMGYWNQPDGGVIWFSNLARESPVGYAEARKIATSDWLRELSAVHADDVPGRELIAHTKPDDLFVLGAMYILPSIPRWHRGRLVLVGDSAHAPSSSSGQGVSLALESAIELARCLRDLPGFATAFTVYERMRRPRVEKVAAEAAKTNARKAGGPIAKAVMSLLMPIATKTFLTPEKMFGWVHRYRVPWDEDIAA